MCWSKIKRRIWREEMNQKIDKIQKQCIITVYTKLLCNILLILLDCLNVCISNKFCPCSGEPYMFTLEANLLEHRCSRTKQMRLNAGQICPKKQPGLETAYLIYLLSAHVPVCRIRYLYMVQMWLCDWECIAFTHRM